MNTASSLERYANASAIEVVQMGGSTDPPEARRSLLQATYVLDVSYLLTYVYGDTPEQNQTVIIEAVTKQLNEDAAIVFGSSFLNAFRIQEVATSMFMPPTPPPPPLPPLPLGDPVS